MNSLLDPEPPESVAQASGLGKEQNTMLKDQMEVDETNMTGEDVWEDMASDAGPAAGPAAGSAAGSAAGLGVGAGLPPYIPEILVRPHGLQRKPRATQASSVWIHLIPDLALSLLAFRKSSFACPPTSLAATIYQNCDNPSCTQNKIRVLCLHIAHFQHIDVQACSCVSPATVLLEHGALATSPSKPQIAVAVNTLEIYQALFERSCIAIQAFTNALTTLYNTRGFELMSKTFDSEHATDPLRQALSQAVHVYSSIQRHIRKMVNDALAMEYSQINTRLSSTV
ncbi:unnamed protein product [Mycena citricolor]|uniref:CxC1-like cysteine cluster associated with KDZ transposases domain-containing protein n=1 Tax=Mycena citricolor TaxID=2018698 RepID=A0AAD2K5T2_9AGAR|nr:unnamed protein product [Mycena citricolor]